ncbi:MAG TPA: siroheme synthase CysG [Thermoanaerobaculia bacterium]|nr:siroheme synthase CysG [Thermoanaerobaculia bacterium]
MLSVAGRTCLVVGGGVVALRKVEGLLDEKARVTVVAPDPVPALEALARDGAIVLERRPYTPGEAGAWALVFATTDRRDVNRQVARDANEAGRWVNVADDPELCTFHLPAQVKRGSLRLLVASGGEAPFVVRRLRRALERRFGREWGEWIEAAGRFRRAVRAAPLPPSEQERAFDAFFERTVDPISFAARVPTEDEVARFLGERGGASSPPERATPSAARAADAPVRSSLVSLVGAGPGDPGLLTVKGRRRLLAADAVVYDRLATPVLPADLPNRVSLHAVGKEAGHHPVPQEEINALLVRLARDGKRVVRLKGGDPYVFGRGSEEAEALHEAGVPFEVVPGVTSGIAAPAYAGIPVTHRREAVRVTLLTAHESAKENGSQVRWDLLARDPHATLVGYMGVTSLPDVVGRLLASGMDPETPGALVQRGTTPAQRVVRAPLRALVPAVRRSGLGPPALFVIGPTARHAAHLDWFASRPLFGERLAIVAPAGALEEPLVEAGASVVELPVPVTEAARVVLGALPVSGVVLRSESDVDALDEERGTAAWPPDAVSWCLSRGAAGRARERGWPRVEEAEGSSLVRTLVEARERGPRR